jgi:hypothetical protein
MKYIAFTLCLALLLNSTSCRKEINDSDCQRIKSGMITNDIDAVKTVMNKFIARLSFETYTEENINKLVSMINQECDLTCSLICFDCIQTLPSQTEIRITISQSGTPVSKTMDLTYNTSNRIVFRNMHD